MIFRIFLLCLLFTCLECSRMFYRGRGKGGNTGIPFAATGLNLPDAEWFEQPLDHFNPLVSKTWKQRFYRNATHYKGGGPVFLMVGGEGEASPIWMVAGAWLTYAETYGALCFQLEHRFYGKSRPTSTLSVKNLSYLSSEQALADLANFIEAMNEKLPPSTKWVLFGGSYPGSLAAWGRLKYPHLVHAAVSASGPLLALADFQDYYKVVEEALNTSGPACVESVAAAQHQLELMLTHRVGQQTASRMFRLCSPLDPDSAIDRQNLFEVLASNFAGVIQYNKDNRQFDGAKATNITIDVICSIMNDSSGGVGVRRLATMNNLLLDTYNLTCLDYTYNSTVSSLRNTSWDAETSEGGRQWTYQTCTEFGFFQTSTLNESRRLFGNFPLSLFERQCTDIFGPKFSSSFLERGVSRTNINYGGMNYQADRIVFIHGSIDPWHALGITNDLSRRAPAIYIEGTAHCANMYPPSENDLPQLTAAREKISTLLGDWLHE